MRASFGLTSKYIENVYEQFFFMKETSNWSLPELYNLPVGLRSWFVKRTIKQREKEQEEIEKRTQKRSAQRR
jgi:hypothetical protein